MGKIYQIIKRAVSCIGLKVMAESVGTAIFEAASKIISEVFSSVIPESFSPVIPALTIPVIPEGAPKVIPEGCSRESRSCKTTKRLRSPTETLGDDHIKRKNTGSPSNSAGRQTFGNAVWGKDGHNGRRIKQTCVAGFTLIELLVVVLIIGVFAAMALPQYQKAVERSIASEMLQQVRTLDLAQDRYYMANGKYATSFDELDVAFPLTAMPKASSESIGVSGAVPRPARETGSAVQNDKYELYIGDLYGRIYSVAWRKGADGAVFAFSTRREAGQSLEKGKIYCFSTQYVGVQRDNWCSRTFGTDPSEDKQAIDFTPGVVGPVP